jgi:uncharacterized membrane protein YphA (DoxX/SURF4 family)
MLGVIFIYASINKIEYPSAFSQAISNYKLFPDILTNLLAIWLPWLELITGLLIITGLWIKGNALILSILSLIFATITGIAILRGLDISCGCFSLADDQKSVQWTHVVQNFGLLVLSLQVLLYDRGENVFALIKSKSARGQKK